MTGAPEPPPGSWQPPPGPYGQQPWGPAPGLSPQEERTWAMFAHIGALIAGVVGFAFLGPLIVMLTQGNKSGFVRRHAVESLNFQLTLLIALAVGIGVSILTLGLALLVFIPVLIFGGIAALVLVIIAGIAANNGQDYRYPVNLRMVK
jgi:uncharacterized Tic20 family protein